MLGVLEADAGAVRCADGQGARRVRRRFGYLPEERGLSGDGGRASSSSPRAAARARRRPPRARPPTQLDRAARARGARRGDAVETLSLGNQQHVQVAAVLVNDPAGWCSTSRSGLGPSASRVAACFAIARRRGVAVRLLAATSSSWSRGSRGRRHLHRPAGRPRRRGAARARSWAVQQVRTRARTMAAATASRARARRASRDAGPRGLLVRRRQSARRTAWSTRHAPRGRDPRRARTPLARRPPPPGGRGGAGRLPASEEAWPREVASRLAGVRRCGSSPAARSRRVRERSYQRRRVDLERDRRLARSCPARAASTGAASAPSPRSPRRRCPWPRRRARSATRSTPTSTVPPAHGWRTSTRRSPATPSARVDEPDDVLARSCRRRCPGAQRRGAAAGRRGRAARPARRSRRRRWSCTDEPRRARAARGSTASPCCGSTGR